MCLHLDDRVDYTTVVASLRVMGIISGTSMDAVDIAVADMAAESGALSLRPVGHDELPYPDELRRRLRNALPPAKVGAGELCALDADVGRAFADAAVHGRDRIAGGIDLIASLGQTLFHWVQDDRARGTLQLGGPAWIAEATGSPVVSDLRSRDVAAGGHGAPLAAMLDALWLAAGEVQPAAALNIGGIANITVVGAGTPLAYDTGPGNALLDCASATVAGQDHDTDGALAARGTVRTDLLDALLADPYYAAPPPKSTGKEHFAEQYLREHLERVAAVDPSDLLATLTELTAITVGDACRAHGVRTVIASGGGVNNPVLMAKLQQRLAGHGIAISTSDRPTGVPGGLPPSGKEAYLTALLGFLSWHGLAGTVAGATGARGARILGSITPGAGPLRLPEPLTEPPQQLRVDAPGPRADQAAAPAATTNGPTPNGPTTEQGNQEGTCASPTSS